VVHRPGHDAVFRHVSKNEGFWDNLSDANHQSHKC
jgi:hypothetical protein